MRTCCDKPEGLSSDDLRALSSAQIAMLHIYAYTEHH